MTANPTLPVYLVHFKAPDWCGSAVDSILASDIPTAVTVVNNGGQLALPDGVTVVENRRNLGYAGGANIALRQWLTGAEPYCVIASHDLHVRPDTLRLLVEAANRSSQFGVLGPVTETNWPGRPLGEQDGVEVRTEMSGTCLLLRRDCIVEIGLFDPTFRSYGEDNELCARARRHGWKVGRVVDAFAEGRGTRHTAYRSVNSEANRPLLALRTDGSTAAALAYLRLTRTLVAACRGRIEMSPSDAGKAAALGLVRLCKGAALRPPRGA